MLMSDMSYPSKEETKFMNVQGGEKKVMKKILSVALSTAMAFSMFASVAFGETATTPQAKFDALAAKGVLNGYPDGQAHLEKDLTRAEFAKIVTKLFDLTEVTNKLSYKDKGYTASNWAVPYIEAVTAANLMQGKDTVKGIFDYNGKVTVEEVAAVLFRALKLETPTTTDNSASAWAKGYAQAVINKGLVAQNTNFKSNASRSLVVETAYAVDQLGQIAKLTVASAEVLSPTSVLVTFSDKTTTTVTLTTALVEGVETTISFKNKEVDYTAKVTLVAPKVVSVTAPNAKQIVVKFNRAIDADTIAETVSNTTTLIDGLVTITALNGAPVVIPNDANVALAADGTEAWITFAGTDLVPQYLDGQYTFTLAKTVTTTAGEAIASFTTLIAVDDNTAPTVTSISSVAKTTTTKVYLKLSEPVKATGLIAYVNGVAATVTRETYAPLDELTLTAGTLETGKTYDVSLLNLSDFAGNLVSPNPYKATVSVTADVQSPAIKSVVATNESTVEVTFSKNVDYNSLLGNVRLLDAYGVSQGYFTPYATSDPKVFKLVAPATLTTNFPSSGSFTGSIVFGATVKDTLGNTLADAFTQAIAFSKDTVAPTVASASYTSGKGLIVKFSEAVKLPATLVSGIKLINDSTGNVTDVPTAPTFSTDLKTLTFASVTGLSTGTYTLRLPSGVVIDTASAKNALAATIVSVSVTAASSSDTVKPTLTVTPNVYSDGKSEKVIKYSVQDASGLNVATLRDTNSYTLNSKALPAGSYVVTNYGSSNASSKAVDVELYIPASGISSTDSYAFVINGLADTAGNAITPVLTQLTLTDAVSPVLSTAVVSSGDSTVLVVGFSEEVQNVAISDLVFKINGVAVTPINAIKQTSGTDKNKYYVQFNSATVGTKLDLSASTVNTISVTVADTATFTDLYANTVTTGTTVYGK